MIGHVKVGGRLSKCVVVRSAGCSCCSADISAVMLYISGHVAVLMFYSPKPERVGWFVPVPADAPAAARHGGPGGRTERDVVRLLGDTRWVVTGDPHDDVDGLLEPRSVSTNFAFVLHEAGTAR
jgi:hypothetical protein